MGITPKKNGFVQDGYADFMGRAVAGMLANASDINLTDAVFVGDLQKVYAGRCYGWDAGVLKTVTADIEPVIAVFEQGAMDSDEDGNFKTDVAHVIRSARVGGRVWVEVVAKGSTVDSTAALHAGTDGKLTDAADGVDVSAKIKVVGEYAVIDGKALVLVEVL